MTRAGRAAFSVGTAIVVLAATIAAASRLAGYAADPYPLWQDLHHDRHGHFMYGLDLALALREFDLIGFLQDLARATIWPPLNGLAIATVMLAGGIDLRLAILPNLIGWGATVVLVWLIGLRLFPDARRAFAAGAIAAAFVFMSPAFRLVTTDVMLEGLGAALSCLCIYCYLRARETPERQLGWRLLALALTALFFEKANYWVLTAAPLALAFMLDEPQRVRDILSRLRGNIGALCDEWRNPLTAACVVLLIAVLAIWAHGPLMLPIFGQRVSLYPPGNLLTVAYALLFIRLALAWRAHRELFDAAAGVALRQLFYWHLLPVTASLLIPKRLPAFLWFVSPAHHHGGGYRPWSSAVAQWDAFASAFHVAPWVAMAAAAGIVIALAMLRRAGPALRIVALVGLVGATAVILHPQQQYRFQTTVLPALWIVSGAGWGMVLALLAERLPRLAGNALIAAAVGALFVAQIGHAPSALAYVAATHPREARSDYDWFKAYRPYLDGARRVGVISTSGRSAFFRWTLAESCRCRLPVDQPFTPRDASREQNAATAAGWLARTQAEVIVAVIESEARYLGIRHDWMLGQFDALDAQSRFVKATTLSVPRLGEVSIWRRRGS